MCLVDAYVKRIIELLQETDDVQVLDLVMQLLQNSQKA